MQSLHTAETTFAMQITVFIYLVQIVRNIRKGDLNTSRLSSKLLRCFYYYLHINMRHTSVYKHYT